MRRDEVGEPLRMREMLHLFEVKQCFERKDRVQPIYSVGIVGRLDATL